MVCLIKSKNKPLLDSYTDILGSEDAAYYVLSQNNGYSLEFTPSGEKSDLFQQLLTKNNYDYEAAIQEKAEMYYSSFYDQIGGNWTIEALDSSVVDEKGEPKIQYTPENIDFYDIFDYSGEFTQSDYLRLSEIQNNIIQDDLDKFVQNSGAKTIHEKHSQKINWLKSRQKKLIDSINSSIIQAFGLQKKTDKDGNVYFVSKEKDESGRYKIVIQFCEYLENGRAGVYDQTGRLEAAANLIQISLTDADATTINHELAHHYIRMFWNTELIQKLANKLDNGDRGDGWQVRLEEKIVDEITKQVSQNSTFWSGFNEMIKTAFRWLSDPVKQLLLRKASIAFRTNDVSLSIKEEGRVLSFIDPTAKRVYQTAPNNLSVEFDNILQQSGIKEATRHFIQDSEQFFQQYSNQPDSILKDQYDDYLLHFKNTMTGINISDQEFNEVLILIRENERNTSRQHHDPSHFIRISASVISQLADEILQIREEIRQSSQQQTSVTQSQQSGQDERMGKLMQRIMNGLKSRIFEYMHTVPKDARKSNEIQELYERLSLIQDYGDRLGLFMQEGMDELRKLYNLLNELESNWWENVTSQQIMSIRNTIDGFYEPIIKLISKTLASDERTIIHNGVLYDLGVKFRDMLATCSIISSKLAKATKAISIRNSHKFLMDEEEGVVSDLFTDPQKERFLTNFDDQLIEGKLFDDINMIWPYIGLAGRSQSLVIRMAKNMILDANNEIRKATLRDISPIIKLYVKALPKLRKLGLQELQSIFQEVDSTGKKTGYFVRRLNYGDFYKKLDEYKTNLVDETNQTLKQELGENAPQITYDYYNNPILPVDDDQVVKRILQEYSDKLDEWMCTNADRMFVPEYYRKRREMLSPNTIQTLSNIQSRINAIMSKAPTVVITDSTGNTSRVQATWELSPEDQQNLVQLRQEYDQLGNQYYSNGTKKSGLELQIAQEITRFNEWKNNQIKYNQNVQRFDAAIQKIREKYGDNSVEESRFRKLNTSVVVNPLYYDYVLSKVSMTQNDELDKLRKRRNDLKKLIDEFDKKGIDIEQKRIQIEYWNELKEVDREITELLESLPRTEGEKWSDYFDKEMVMYDQNTTLLDHMLQQDIREYRQFHPADSRTDSELREELIQKYQYVYTWYDTSGGTHQSVGLVSVFVRQVPKGASINEGKTTARFNINGHTRVFTDALITRYSQQFSDVDPESPLYNQDYDRNSTAFVQPKSDVYSNSKQWNVIEKDSDLLELYNALVDLMHRNNSRIPNTNADNYKLPQITARRLTILRRSSSLKELGDALKYNWQNEWKLNDRDDSDINYENADVRTRQDGTRINTVPVRFLKMDDTDKITSDVIGSIIAFTEMSYNFEIKTQLSSELELIKQQLLERENPGIAKAGGQFSTKNTIKHLNNLLDDQLYGNTTKLGDKNVQFSKSEQRLIKFMRHFQHMGRILMLGWNLTSMRVGFWESAIRGLIEASLGKDYTMRDYWDALGKLRKYSKSMAAQIGDYKVRNKLVAEMQEFGISKRVKESYHGTERRRMLRLLNENLDGMFGFTLGDYTNSSFQFMMAMSNVRFIEGDSYIKSGFYTKLTLIRAYQNSGFNMSYKDAKNIALNRYNQSGITLDDAYVFENGELKLDQQYEQYVTKRITNRVTGKCYQRLSEALGVTPTDDNPGYGLQVLLKPLGALRSYMFTVISRQWNRTHDLQRRYLDENGKISKEDDMIDGYVDIDAGNMNIELHQGLIGWFKMIGPKLPLIKKIIDAKDVTEETRELYNYSAKKALLEVLTIVTMVGISVLFKAMAKGADDKDWWYRSGYLTSVRLVNSFLSVLDPTALLEVIKNISTLISPLTDLIRSVTTLSDLVGLSGHSPFEEIKSGSYKDRTRLFRNLMRITPFGNLYEDLSPSALKSRANWYLQQDPLIWSSVGGAFDQLWGTDSEPQKEKKKKKK